MSFPIVYKLGSEPILDHVFSPSGDVLAITVGDSVKLYKVQGLAKPEFFAELKGHAKTVTSVDISPDGSRILTCSQDRNALVWEMKDNEYKPTLVLLRINRAATVCRWSPLGNKFAVGSADRIIAVCYYEEENDWWVSKHLKKPLKSTITSLNWHANNVLLSCGSTDGHSRVFSTFIKGLDSKPEASAWGSKLPFQTLCSDFISETGAWVHSVAFNSTGDILAFVNHDSSLNVVYPQGEGLPPLAFHLIKTSHLPFRSLVFVNDNKIAAGGNDNVLVIFEGNQDGWKEVGPVEKILGPVAKHSSTLRSGDDDDEISSHDALNMFKQLDLRGRVTKTNTGGAGLSTSHQNTITSVKLYSLSHVSTSGDDGRVVVFQV